MRTPCWLQQFHEALVGKDGALSGLQSLVITIIVVFKVTFTIIVVFKMTFTVIVVWKMRNNQV